MKATKSMIEREIRNWFGHLSIWADMVERSGDIKSFEDAPMLIKRKLRTLEFYLKEWKEADDLRENKKCRS